MKLRFIPGLAAAAACLAAAALPASEPSAAPNGEVNQTGAVAPAPATRAILTRERESAAVPGAAKRGAYGSRLVNGRRAKMKIRGVSWTAGAVASDVVPSAAPQSSVRPSRFASYSPSIGQPQVYDAYGRFALCSVPPVYCGDCCCELPCRYCSLTFGLFDWLDCYCGGRHCLPPTCGPFLESRYPGWSLMYTVPQAPAQPGATPGGASMPSFSTTPAPGTGSIPREPAVQPTPYDKAEEPDREPAPIPEPAPEEVEPAPSPEV